MKPYQLHHGDAIEFMRTLEPGSVQLTVTDPPYNVSQKNVDVRFLARPGQNGGTQDFGEWDYDFQVGPVAEELSRVLAPNCQAYIFSSAKLIPEWIASMTPAFEFRLLSWIKPDPVPSAYKRHWRSATEHVLWFFRGSYTFNYGQHSEMFTWYLQQSPKTEERCHPTQKPVRLLAHYIRVSSNEGDLILDPFAGSGSTGVAALKEGRRFIGSELDADYHAIALQRLEAAYQQPRLLETA